MAAQHWVSDVFPVQYTVEDTLSDRTRDDMKTACYAREKLKDLYENAFCRVLAERDHAECPEKKGTVLESSERKCEPISNSVETYKKTKKDENCLWTKEELDVFRDGFFNLKRRAVHLLILLSDSKTRNSELRKKCKNKDIIIANQDHLLSAQKKEIMKSTATIKELQKDLGYSEKKLQQLLIIEAQYKDQNAFLKTELEEERNEIKKLQLACRDLNRSLTSMQRKTELGLVEQRNILIAQYKHTQEKVEEEKEKLQKELEREKQEHHLTKIALDQLRRHFAHIQANKADKFLDVTETENMG